MREIHSSVNKNQNFKMHVRLVAKNADLDTFYSKQNFNYELGHDASSRSRQNATVGTVQTGMSFVIG